MTGIYGRDLDLNLLRVFVVVAEEGSVTGAAARLYLTQPAVSAALKRLSAAMGAPVFVRQGRTIALTARGARLLAAAKPHLDALVTAALAPARFDPATSERVIRIGLSDASEAWLLPPLLRVLEREASRMRLVVLPVQFRSLAEALASERVDLAITVADDLPAGTRRRTLFVGGFTCVFDPRHARVGKRLTRARYFAHEHVIVSYNGDLRGVVEDSLGMNRRVRCSIPGFHNIGAVIEGTALLATLPTIVAAQVLDARPRLTCTPLPFTVDKSPIELLWRAALDDDEAVAFIRDHVVRIAERTATEVRRRLSARGSR
jgi:LysR family transcriptional activator of mexEF-oprN operon